LGKVNGCCWGCIYSPNHFLAVAPFLPTVDGPCPWSRQSAHAHQRLKSQRSAVTAISTATVHKMCRQMSGTAVADGPAVHTGRSARTLKIHFTEPVTFGFFCFSPTGRSAQRSDGPRLVPDGARFSIERFVVLTCVYAVFLSEGHPGVADDSPQGPGRSALRCFSKKLLLSEIIYGIPDSRFRIVVDKLVHL
jgi:hypothetical protein